MKAATDALQKRQEKFVAENECPYQLTSYAEGLLCFDVHRTEYVKPSEKVMAKWCRSDFLTCPNYLFNEGHSQGGMREPSML
jgi:hypothetical protein